MKILFGLNLDGCVWNDGEASIGSVRTGPMGFLGILESRLGLSKPSVHPVRRIDGYMKRLQENDHESKWYHRSFVVDPWSTAREMLMWRDELVEAGWKGDLSSAGSPRLESLAELEKMDIQVPLGRADRLREVVDCLKDNVPAYIDSISLVEAKDMLPPVCQEVLVLLEDQGTVIDAWKELSAGDSSSNLSIIKNASCDREVESVLSDTDDSLILMKADNEWEAADHLALWLASREDNKDVTIICGMDTGVLDRALERHGLPSLGRAESSKWRESQQILPLVLANAWNPVDIRLMTELLSLTLSPLPSWVCRYLMNAISQEPGVGGRAWKKALDRIAERKREDLAEKKDDKTDEKVESFIKGIQSLLVEDRFDPMEGIPEDKLRQRCQTVVEWLGWRIESDPALAEVVGHAREIQELSKGKGCIQKITLERMLDTVIGAGSVSDEIYEEAGDWNIVDHPGQIVAPCGEIVWWGFNDSSAYMPTFWSQDERNALESDGILLEESRNIRRREAWSWKQGLLCAKKRFMAIHIAQLDGEETYHHPYWDTIWCIAEDIMGTSSEEFIEDCLVKECRDFDHKRDWEFAGRRSVLERVPEWEVQQMKEEHYVAESAIGVPERLSYSQMSTLIGCPMKWALEYHARLSLSASQVIPTGNQMIGSLCHRIIEELYEKDEVLDRDLACRRAEELYDSLLPSMASELLLDVNAMERKRYGTAVVEAVGQLIEALKRHGLRIEKTEAPLEGKMDDIPFIGYADLFVRDSYDNLYVLDLKWSSYSKYRKEEMAEGSALQLATYAWMIRSSGHSQPVDAGYFMLAQGELLSDSKDLADDVIESPHTLEEIWNMGAASYRDVWDHLASGLVEVRGVEELITSIEENVKEEELREGLKNQYRERGMLYQKPPCSFCDFSRLCGMAGGRL